MIYTSYRKRKIILLYRKKRKTTKLFYLIDTTYHKKKLHAFTAKKKQLHNLTIFLYTSCVFHEQQTNDHKPENSVPAP